MGFLRRVGLAVFLNDRWCNSGHITIKEQHCGNYPMLLRRMHTLFPLQALRQPCEALMSRLQTQHRKGQNRLYLLWRLRSFGVQGALLKTFYDSVMASAINHFLESSAGPVASWQQTGRGWCHDLCSVLCFVSSFPVLF